MKRIITAFMLVTAILAASVGSVYAKNNPQLNQDVTEGEIESAQVSLQLAKEGIVLLENNNAALPIADAGNVALFGIGMVKTTKGGTGSGSVNNRIVYEDGSVIAGEGVSTTILDGFVKAGYQVLTADYLEKLIPGQEDGGYMMGAVELSADAAVSDFYTEEELAALASQTDTAFYAVRRNAGEGADRTIENDYELTEIELANIHLLADTFDKLVVLLNVINCDASWFAESGADALVLVSNPGELGGEAIISVLNGETNPSGKLADTWAKSIYDWPSTKYFSNINPDDPWADKVEYYFEDVFVGYRYFDTFNADAILYDFGYGLSYTTFEISVDEVLADAQTATVTATVTNTGERAGKEVVQVYSSAPQGRIPKPYQELAAYGKTDEIAPGESQTLTISFSTDEMASYDEDAASYILEAGDYVLRVGNSSRNTIPAAVITLDADAVTERLANKMSMSRYGVYPGGSSHEYDSLTQEDNVSKWQELHEAFLEENKDKKGLDGGQEAAVTLALSAADFVAKAPYEEKGKDPASEDVEVYISATTPIEAAGETGYDYALGKEYRIIPVEFTGEDGALQNFRVKSGSEEDGTAEYYTLMDVQKGTLTLEQFISGLTVEELADIAEGGEGRQFQLQYGEVDAPEMADVVEYIKSQSVDGQAGQTCALYYDTFGIPTMINADGPAGVRLTQHYMNADGEDCYQFCTAFPVGTMIAQTWNTDMAYKMGCYIGRELCQYGVTQLLAPGMNIHRNPLCGRNFEYYSEDPLLAGLTGGYEALGLQSNKGVGVTFKHFAGNDQENGREQQNDVVTERAFREIYLHQFELAVKLSNPMCIMTSYGLVNGTPTANDWELTEDILRTEWGFDGFVMTDWHGSGGMTDALAMHSGNDMIMPGNYGTLAILPYVTDNAPSIEFDEDGLAIDGGYPSTVPLSRVFGGGAFVWRNLITEWGDYKPDPEGSVYEVRTTEEAFTTQTRTLLIDNAFVDKTVEEIVMQMQEEGTASFEKNEDGSVTISYKLVQNSLNDGTNYAPTYRDHPVTIGVNLFGEEDINTLSLADLQKSAKRVLSVAMRSLQWQEMLDAYAQATGEDMGDAAVGSFTQSQGPA